MNYSTYFDNKVESHFTDCLNVFVISSKEEIIRNFTTKDYSEVESLIKVLDPYNVILKGNEITLKVYYGEEV
jgi:hypothetical protein